MPNTRSFKPKSIPTAEDLIGGEELRTTQNNSDGQNSGVSENTDSPSPSESFRNAPMRDLPTEQVTGVLDIMPEGHGFLRPKYTPSEKDVYISDGVYLGRKKP